MFRRWGRHTSGRLDYYYNSQDNGPNYDTMWKWTEFDKAEGYLSGELIGLCEQIGSVVKKELKKICTSGNWMDGNMLI